MTETLAILLSISFLRRIIRVFLLGIYLVVNQYNKLTSIILWNSKSYLKNISRNNIETCRISCSKNNYTVKNRWWFVKLPQVDFLRPKSGKWPGVNFTIILWAAFEHADPKSAKKIDTLTVIFALSGSASITAGHRTLMKLTPGVGVNFIHHFTSRFCVHRSQKRKMTDDLTVFLRFWDLGM